VDIRRVALWRIPGLRVHDHELDTRESPGDRVDRPGIEERGHDQVVVLPRERSQHAPRPLRRADVEHAATDRQLLGAREADERQPVERAGIGPAAGVRDEPDARWTDRDA
jgi:hypothetical protein